MSELALKMPRGLRTVRLNGRGAIPCRVVRSEHVPEVWGNGHSQPGWERKMRGKGFLMLYDPSGDFRPGAYFDGMAMKLGVEDGIWLHNTMLVSLQSGMVRRYSKIKKHFELTSVFFHKGVFENMRDQVDDFIDKTRHKGRIFFTDQEQRITVDGQTAVIRGCKNCGMKTPHGLTVGGKHYCGICGASGS